MWKIIEEWSPLNNGIFILTLDKKIPPTRFEKYRINGKEYEPVFVHIQGEYLLRTIALKGAGGFVGKEVEFV